MKRIYFPLALIAASALPGSAATTGLSSIHTDNFSYSANPILDESGGILAVGSNIQVGYFTTPFPVGDVDFDWNSFVPLTGDGSNNLALFASNPDFQTTIGKGTENPTAQEAGYFNLSASFDDGVHSDVAASSARIGVRIFNAGTVAASTHFNTVTSSDSDWVLPAPNEPQPTPAKAWIDGFPGPPLTWESGGTGTFQTSLALANGPAVPEASEALIILLGLTGILRHRRRR